MTVHSRATRQAQAVRSTVQAARSLFPRQHLRNQHGHAERRARSTAPGTVTVSGGSFTGNTAGSGNGGAIANTGLLTITSVNFTGNSASQGDGGAIDNVGPLAVTGSSTISSNLALNGGGIFNVGNFRLANSTVSDNSAAETGGGVNYSSGSVSASWVTIAW